jgi:hydrogenase maturation protein HypF
MATYHIHLSGIVQGVGFRPFVYQLALSHKLCGRVNNGNDGVHIEITAPPAKAEAFYRQLVDRPPKLATITRHEMREIAAREFTRFEIIASDSGTRPSLPLTPDFALCQDCRQEIDDKNNRRFNYAFTTCTNCGPRYSIITGLPYDRPNTTMAGFEQCDECRTEYHNPLNRRHFSQTNSCNECGIEIMVDEDLPVDNDLDKIINYLDQGKILAVKGIGGFLLICNAINKEAIKRLRHRKNRPTKPFAVMYPHLEMIKADFQVTKEEETRFTDEVAPIILLQPKSAKLSLHQATIAPGLNRIGCMIPYAPLFHLLLKHYQKPVIATSGNISGSPIIYHNRAAREELAAIADVIITNNRDIMVPQDDSVISFTTNHHHQIILRRSRGLAPTFLDPGLGLTGKSILALGAQMKSSFALTNEGSLYVSQYLGDMDNYLTQDYYEQTVDHFFKVFKTRPETILGDRHPDYFTSRYGSRLANELAVPFVQVQHHKAHFYAVLAENKLLPSSEPILGVIWDGTGYGDDGQIWGGEFFLGKDGHCQRVAHIPYFPFILGNKMPREPRISALAFGSLGTDDNYLLALKHKFSSQEWGIYQNMLAAPTLRTSSMGRVFDAVAAIVLDIDKTSYEGEAAMMLEAAASAWLSKKPITSRQGYNISSESSENAFTNLFHLIIDDKKNNISTGEIAARFHLSLVNLIRHEAEKQEVKTIAFSGGVFQNGLLVDLIKTILQDDYQLLFHQRLSPNDENIAYGQLAWYIMHEKT